MYRLTSFPLNSILFNENKYSALYKAFKQFSVKFIQLFNFIKFRLCRDILFFSWIISLSYKSELLKSMTLRDFVKVDIAIISMFSDFISEIAKFKF